MSLYKQGRIYLRQQYADNRKNTLAQVPSLKGFLSKTLDYVMVSTEVSQPLPHFYAGCMVFKLRPTPLDPRPT